MGMSLSKTSSSDPSDFTTCAPFILSLLPVERKLW
jgi:hypothetical protein